MIGVVLGEIAHSELNDPDRDALAALGQVAEELADEMGAVGRGYLEEANKVWLSRHPKLARLIKQAEARCSV